ncbi:unnamed protein product [Prorocentrum cordatum]|uniref:Uncharacterized protein n=1 Tax=Prorocentrum cordatum TaxID=2364126 RepID=A0ABN9TQE7_9DINO|nr:unnamed protein product [Polarella glacialis]
MFAPELAGQKSGLRGLGQKLSSPLKGFSVQKKADGLKRRAQKRLASKPKGQDEYFAEPDAIFVPQKEDPFSTTDQKKMVVVTKDEFSSSGSSSGDSDSSDSDGGGGNAQGDKAMKVVASCTLRLPAVGERVRHVEWMEREDGEWSLNREEVAVVAEVDAQGDFRLRNEHGQVSPHFLLRKYYCFTEVEELLPCQSRKPEVGWCVRSDGPKEVTCDEWTLAAGETAEVAQVGPYLDFKLRNPSGATTPKFLPMAGFSYVQVVRSCMVRWPAIGNKVRKDGGRPVTSGEWTLAAGEVAVVAQVDSKGAFRLRGASTSGGSSSSVSPVFFPRRRYCYVDDGVRPAEAAGAPREAGLDFQPRRPDGAADPGREPADKGRSKTKIRKADKKAAEPAGGAAAQQSPQFDGPSARLARSEFQLRSSRASQGCTWSIAVVLAAGSSKGVGAGGGAAPRYWRAPFVDGLVLGAEL